MVLQLMKIAISGDIDTDINPDSAKFFYVTTVETSAGSTLSIDAASFLNDTGVMVTELPVLAEDNGYFTVEINGVEQMQGISTYTPGVTGTGSLEIAVPADGISISANQPVTFQLLKFSRLHHLRDCSASGMLPIVL